MKKLTNLLFAAVLGVSLVGCGADGEVAPVETEKPIETEAAEVVEDTTEDVYHGEEGKITVYLSGPEKMVNLLEEAFEEERGDVVEMFHAGCGPLKQKIYTEVESGNVLADVYFGSNPLIFDVFKDKGVLCEYVSPNAEGIKEDLKTDGSYTFVNTRYQVIVYDTDTFDKENAPKNYNDLLDAQFDGKIAYTDPSQSDTSLALTCALYELNDNSMQFFEGLKDIHPLIVPKSKTVTEDIQAHETLVGICPHDAIVRLNRKAKKEGFDSNLGLSWPKDGAIELDRPIAIMKNDARPETNQKLAEEFVDFMLSEKGQAITSKFGFYSVMEGASAPKGLPEDVNAIQLNWKELSTKQAEINDEFESIFAE